MTGAGISQAVADQAANDVIGRLKIIRDLAVAAADHGGDNQSMIEAIIVIADATRPLANDAVMYIMATAP